MSSFETVPDPIEGPELVITADGEIRLATDESRAGILVEADLDLSSDSELVALAGQADWKAGAEDVLLPNGQALTACIPVAASEATVMVGRDALAAAANASVHLAHLDAEVMSRFGGVSASVETMLVNLEAIGSSRIEGIKVTPYDLARSRLKSAPNGGDLARRCADLTAAAFSLADDVDDRTLRGLHQSFMDGVLPDAGSYREGQVWIGVAGLGPAHARFVPPAASRVPSLMGDLAAFCARTDLAAFVHAAVAHAQFETIHPFSDGNGRTGRALVHALLRKHGLSREAVLPLSATLHRPTYFEALAEFREGRMEPIVECFAAATILASLHTPSLLDEVQTRLQEWRWRLQARSDAVAWKVLTAMPGQPVVSVGDIAARFGVSFPAAQRAVDQLVEAGALQPCGEQRRGRLWRSDEMLSAMASFLSRTGPVRG